MRTKMEYWSPMSEAIEMTGGIEMTCQIEIEMEVHKTGYGQYQVINY